MPAIKAGSKVLVTGASGFIAVHIVEAFLNKGYPIVGTVRSKEKGEYLKNLFKEAKSPFDYVIVEDVAQAGAFDEAVKGVDAVAHTASPFHFDAAEPSELIKPAVQGTLGILESLRKNNPDIQRIVITSSYAAIITSTLPQPHRFTEADWNDYDPGVCEREGKEAPATSKYRASKVLAERGFWKWIEDNKPTFDGVTINPPMVLGPLNQQLSSVDQLNTSAKQFWSYMSGQKKQDDLPDNPGSNWVNVHDVAEAHVRALEVPEASGQRFLVSAGPYSGNDFAVFLNEDYPDLKNVPRGTPGIKDKLSKEVNVADGLKATRVLGIRYRSLDETLRSMGKDLERFLLQVVIRVACHA